MQDNLQVPEKIFDDLVMLPKISEGNPVFPLAPYCQKTIDLYLLKRYDEAIATARLAARLEDSPLIAEDASTLYFYYLLALLGKYNLVGDGEKSYHLLWVIDSRKQFNRWKGYNLENWQNQYNLLGAELARVTGKKKKAIALYERAIEGFKEREAILEEAIANELAAEFHWQGDREPMGKFLIVEAYNAYYQWGARDKLEELELRYPQVIGKLIYKDRSVTGKTKLDQTRTTYKQTSDWFYLESVMKASQAISSEIVISRLLDKLMDIALKDYGGQQGVLLLKDRDELEIAVVGKIDGDKVIAWQYPEIELSEVMPISAIAYVQNTQKSLAAIDATTEKILKNDPYILKNKPKSVYCTPIIQQGQLIGLLYLEKDVNFNNATSEHYIKLHNKCCESLKILSSQAAISLENARLCARLKSSNQQLEEYSHNLEAKIKERIQELNEKNEQLQEIIEELRRSQAQLIHTERMSSIGQLVAGIAHEINNPVNFIYGNLTYARDYIEQLLDLLEMYEETYSNPSLEIKNVKQNVIELLESMEDRSLSIRNLVLSLRNFSRLDETQMKQVDIHTGIKSTLLILQHRLKQTIARPAIQLIENYGKIPVVECYAGQLNQVFMNILINAIDALEDVNAIWRLGNEGTQQKLENPQVPTLWVLTEAIADRKVIIRIADNGSGLTESAQTHLFEPFFTTKSPEKGTGLGLSISYQIVVEKHGGQLYCNSRRGGGTEFAIALPIKQRFRTSPDQTSSLEAVKGIAE